MASMNIVPYHMGPYGHPYHQFDIHPSQFAHLSAQDAWHFSGTGQRLNQLYQEPYPAASVASGYQSNINQNTQDLTGSGSGIASTTTNADCVKYPQEF